MTASSSHKSSSDQPLLVSVAESIGATLGTIAAKADAAQRAISKQKFSGEVKRGSRKLVRKGKQAAAKLTRAAKLKKLKSSKPARAARRVVRKTAKRVAGRRKTKK